MNKSNCKVKDVRAAIPKIPKICVCCTLEKAILFSMNFDCINFASTQKKKRKKNIDCNEKIILKNVHVLRQREKESAHGLFKSNPCPLTGLHCRSAHAG